VHPMRVNTTDNQYLFVGELGYYTHYQDPYLSLLELGVRFYEPATGRFTQRDPLGFRTGLGLYRYALDNPLVYMDPTGLKTPPKDWIKRAYQCSKESFEQCRLDYPVGSKEYNECYWSEFAKCMGKRWGKTECKDYFCALFPRNALCDKGYNPCDKEKAVPGACQDCCDIKAICCAIFGGAPTVCKEEHRSCYVKCEVGGCKNK